MLYGCETLSLALRNERKLRVFENRIFRGEYLVPKGLRLGSGEGFILRNFILCIVHVIYRYSG